MNVAKNKRMKSFNHKPFNRIYMSSQNIHHFHVKRFGSFPNLRSGNNKLRATPKLKMEIRPTNPK